MNISLAPELEKIVGDKVRRGQYQNANALVHEAVERLVEADEEERTHRSEIRKRIAIADAEIERGEFHRIRRAHASRSPPPSTRKRNEAPRHACQVQATIMKLRMARSAATDLDEIWIYIARRESVEVAERFLTFLTDKFYVVLRNPGIGRNRPDLREGVRSFPAGNYRIYYRREKKAVVRILYIRHAARDERKLFP